jgi:hypothetical protein
VTETLRIEAPDAGRGGSYSAFDAKIGRRSRAVLGVFLGCLSLCLYALHAQPVTSAYVEVEATFTSGSRSNTTLADLFASMDTSSSSEVWFDRAQAQTSFGLNSAYASSQYTYTTISYVHPLTPHPTATASYILSWSTLDHSASGNILSLSLSLSSLSGSNWISGLQFGSFQFQYGTPYIIQSSLSVVASFDGGGPNGLASTSGYGLAKSLWSDTFTIHGQPDGTSGVAGFDVS